MKITYIHSVHDIGVVHDKLSYGQGWVNLSDNPPQIQETGFGLMLC